VRSAACSEPCRRTRLVLTSTTSTCSGAPIRYACRPSRASASRPKTSSAAGAQTTSTK
jgi:hypothetical protein